MVWGLKSFLDKVSQREAAEAIQVSRLVVPLAEDWEPALGIFRQQS